MVSIILIQNCRLVQNKKTTLSLILILACKVLEMLTFDLSFLFDTYPLCSFSAGVNGSSPVACGEFMLIDASSGCGTAC